MTLDDVRDPHKWRKFIAKARLRAQDIASNSRSRLGLQIDLGVVDPKLGELQRLHAAIYKLTRIAVSMEVDYSRKEIVNLYNAIIFGPSELRSEALKLVERLRE
jgi:hypothetical protein